MRWRQRGRRRGSGAFLDEAETGAVNAEELRKVMLNHVEWHQLAPSTSTCFQIMKKIMRNRMCGVQNRMWAGH